MSWISVPLPEWLETEDDVLRASEYLCANSQDGIGYDTETTGNDTSRDTPILFSMSAGDKRYCGPAEFLHHPAIKDLILTNPKIVKIGTNLKFDVHTTANAGIDIQGPLEDTLPMDWLWNENRVGRHGLKETARDHVGLRMFGSFRKVFQPKPKRKGVPAETAGSAIRRAMEDPTRRAGVIDYSSMDAFGSKTVRNGLKERLVKVPWQDSKSLWDYYQEIEVPFTRVTYNCERRGFPILTGHLKSQYDPMQNAITEIETEIAQKVGYSINPKSTPALRQLFFDEMKYKPFTKTKTGVGQVNEAALQKWAAKGCKVSQMIMGHRNLSKGFGTYVKGLLKRMGPDLRLHTTLNQHIAVTGRLTSSKPNLQNIPGVTDDDFMIRAAFVAPLGRLLVVLDYDQLELKITAHFSEDSRMINAILEGQDLHCFTVSQIAGIPYDEVVGAKHAKEAKQPLTDRQKYLLQMRQCFKRTIFGIIYGIGRNKLSVQLSEDLDRVVTPTEAQGYIDGIFKTFPGVKRFIALTHEECRKNEFVRTIGQRYRRLPSINSVGGGDDTEEINANKLRAQAERQSVNVIIQGSGADVVKAAMLLAESDPVLKSYDANMLLQIHDELIFDCPNKPKTVEGVKKRVKYLMENTGFVFRVPLTASGGHGASWAAAKS